MTPTEVFYLFLRKGALTPNERLAFIREIRTKIRCGDARLCCATYWKEQIPTNDVLERTFAERLIWNSVANVLQNTLGKYGYSSCCICLTSFMKYLLYYVPTIIGDAKHKNKYLERENIETTNKIGYKRFWQRRLIKKWHDFLKEYIKNGNYIFFYRSDIPSYKLREGVTV